MPTPMGPFAVAATLLVYAAVVFLPGLLAGYAAGLRGWLLAGTAPVLSYAIVGLAGPWFALIDVPYTLWTFVLFAAAVVGIAALLRRLRPAEPPDEPTPWSRHAHQGVVVFLLIGVAVGVFTVLWGMGGLHVIPQGFDAPLHANGLRYIAESGDGSLHGMNSVHRWGDTERLFYPNAYHLLGSLVYQLTGAPVPAILNANSVLLPGLLALSLVTLVRQFRGRAVFAGAVAVLAVVPATLLYGLMIGPLLPFMLGIALLPVIPVLIARYLDRPSTGTGFVLVLGGVGLLAIHTSAVFSSVLFAVPLLAYRWFGNWRRARTEVVRLGVVGVIAGVVALPHLIGALGRAVSPYPYGGWRSDRSIPSALAELFDFRTAGGVSHLALLVVAVIGILCFRRLGRLRWMAVAAALTGVFWVLVAAVDTRFVIALTRPWWDDPLRLMAIAAIPMTVLAAHGISEVQRWLRDRLDARVFHPRDLHPSARAATTAALVVALFCLASGGFYVRSNAELIAEHTGHGDIVVISQDEARAMLELERLAAPGDWAMNDRYDGMVWSYALGGVRTVAGHFGGALLPRDAELLAKRFNAYPDDPEVRAAVKRMNLRWVIVGREGFLPNFGRQPGMTDLGKAPFLQLAYRNSDAAIYRIVGRQPDDAAPPMRQTSR